MKKVKTAAALLCSACLVLSGTAVPTMADSVKVVTLGADLTQDQKNTMMKYFNVDSNQVQILTITNQDERDHLSAYVPLEQIGTRTVSCAYVKPTQSGGIKVRTANLNWVTCNMIATSLSTSGVKNCEVVAACPFEVSGTGALTGIQMAYETATGEQLDSTKKELATEEMVVTGNLADEVGKNDATTVMNNSKIQVIKDNVQNVDDIYNIVVNVAQQNNVNLDSDQINKIVELLKQIAQQEYNYDDVKATLEQVEQNTSGDNDELGDIDDGEEPRRGAEKAVFLVAPRQQVNREDRPGDVADHRREAGAEADQRVKREAIRNIQPTFARLQQHQNGEANEHRERDQQGELPVVDQIADENPGK